jgi:hypothetical protein
MVPSTLVVARLPPWGANAAHMTHERPADVAKRMQVVPGEGSE